MKNILRPKYVVKFILILITIFIVSFWFTPNEKWGGDYAQYLLQTESIVNGNVGDFIEQSEFAISQSDHSFGPITYPWGYPIILLIGHLFGGLLIHFKYVGLFFFLMYLLVLWDLSHKQLGVVLTAVLISAFLLNKNFQYNIWVLGSDIPFLFFSTLSIYMMHGIIISNINYKYFRWKKLILIGILISFASLVRTNGILLLVVLLMAQTFEFLKENHFFIKKTDLVKSKEKLKVFLLELFIPFSVFILVSFISSKFLSNGGDSYIQFLTDVSISEIRGNFVYYIELIKNYFDVLANFEILSVIVFIFFGIGAISNFKKYYYVFIYMLLTLILYIIWPFQQGLRFLYPILPFYFLFALLGFKKVFLGKYKSLDYIMIGVLMLSITIPLLSSTYDTYLSREELKGTVLKTSPYSTESQEAFEWIEDNTDINDVIIFFKPRVMRYQTARIGLLILNTENIGRGDYLVIYDYEPWLSSLTQFKPEEVIKLKQDNVLKAVYSNTKYDIYKIIK